MFTGTIISSLFLLPSLGAGQAADDNAIDRKVIVQSYNPRRSASSESTPLQVGNGDFAFGADVTGLQTFKPFATLSSWGWHNFSLPTTEGQTSIDDFTGLDWLTETQDGPRMVNYNQPNPDEDDISTWLIKNPHRINLGTVGFGFSDVDTTEDDLEDTTQVLDMWTGKITSSFVYKGFPVTVETLSSSSSSTVQISVQSEALATSDLYLFLDFPYPNSEKFNAPFVGWFNETEKHSTSVTSSGVQPRAVITRQMDATTYYVDIRSEQSLSFMQPDEEGHRVEVYPGRAEETDTLILTVEFKEEDVTCAALECTEFKDLSGETETWWEDYWMGGAFLDLTATEDERAEEIQRRVILSQYLTAVNCASYFPPQESGLTNNGWYGKFHLEMYLWHALHWAHWNKWEILWKSLHHIYNDYLQSSIDRAAEQGYTGARWGKMTDPTGRSAPGEINSLLIWQQPHPMYFAELEYRTFSNITTLERWRDIVHETAEFMSSYAWKNETTGKYNLGLPMYDMGENTTPEETVNPTFELAYWRFGLEVAIWWKDRMGEAVPERWREVRDDLAPLPKVNGTYPTYEGIPDMWEDEKTVEDHPGMTGIFGLLPPPIDGLPLDITAMQKTADMVAERWDLENSFGWDFPMLAMNAVKLGDSERAVDYLLHPMFEFDDAGYPVGGVKVPTPYFPASSSLLLAVSQLAAGWEWYEGAHWPEGWVAKAENFVVGLGTTDL